MVYRWIQDSKHRRELEISALRVRSGGVESKTLGFYPMAVGKYLGLNSEAGGCGSHLSLLVLTVFSHPPGEGPFLCF